MKLKKWMSIAAAVCLAVTAVPMQAAAQADFAQEMLAESKEEPVEEIVEEMLAESKEEPQEELKEEPEGKEELQEQPAEEIEPQGEEVSLLTGEENGIVVLENADTDFEGTGDKDDPYLIENAADLRKLAEKVNSGETYEGKHFKQTKDIDLENETWTPIGFFKGIFDGGGYQITNLKITEGSYVGLFGSVENAIIRNCNVAGEVNGSNSVGGIVGSAGKYTQILNCSFQGNVKGNQNVGGIAGGTSGGCEVSNCYVIGTVHGDVSYVGGIVGYAYGTIKNCYALADVSAGGNFVGGIAGYTSNLNIENCYYSGEVSASKYVGGIVGNATSGITVKNCVSLAKSVTGGERVNRIVGNDWGNNFSGNYAWSGTKVNDKTVSDDDGTGSNGKDITYTDGKLSPQFSEIFGSDNSAWKFTEDGLPILKGAGGEQSVYLPSYIRGTEFQGTGEETDPYLIRNINDLKLLSDNVNSGEKYENTYFKQTADINLIGSAWTPIGTVTDNNEIRPFKGKFDGGGYKITNLKRTRSTTGSNSYVGLFGYVENATIRNCNVKGEVEGYNDVGGIVGDAGVNTKILNCSFQGDVIGTGEEVGGIAGRTSGGCEVSGCYVTGIVTGGKYAGGIAGYACGTIQNCYALAEITATGVDAGGIAGGVYDVTIENCYYSGNVSAEDCAGGIIGYTVSSKKIENCVSLAKSVTGGENVNRIAGDGSGNLNLKTNYGYNRTKLVVNGKEEYADIDTTDTKQGTTVFVSAGKVMTDVQKNEAFDWAANGFSTENGWSISDTTGLPYLREDVTPDLRTLPSKDLTINEEPQHFTTKNIGNGFVVKVTSEETLSDSIKFTVKYRLSGTGEDAWTETVPNTAGTYDVQITSDAHDDINPFACVISEGLVLHKKHSSSSSATTPTYTAEFDTNGGSAVSKAKTDENGKIEKPADPTKEGYLFAGWYSDSKLTKRFDFGTALTADTTL